MRKISTDDLKIILDNHAKFLTGLVGGERANLRYAGLRYANLRSADLRYADLRSADLRYADLRYANLSSANLRYADLRYADLSSANLSSANLSSATGLFFITQRSDGYQFFLVQDDSSDWFVRAGCRYMTIKDYRDHANTYSDSAKRVETGLILDFAEAKLRAHGYNPLPGG